MWRRRGRQKGQNGRGGCPSVRPSRVQTLVFLEDELEAWRREQEGRGGEEQGSQQGGQADASDAGRRAASQNAARIRRLILLRILATEGTEVQIYYNIRNTELRELSSIVHAVTDVMATRKPFEMGCLDSFFSPQGFFFTCRRSRV